METNAARELLKIVDRWDAGSGQYLAGKRIGKSTGSISRRLWVQQNRAVTLLMEIEAFSREIGDEVEDDPFFGEMWKYIYAPSKNWSSSDSGIVLDKMVRRNLETLSRFMAGHRSSPSLGDTEVEALRSAIQECLDLLEVAPGGDEEHRRHVAYLLKRSLDILNGESVDLIALQNLSFQAVGAAMSDATLWTWDKSGSFFQNVSVIARVWGPKVAAQAATDMTANLLIDGGKVAAQVSGTVIKGLIEAGAAASD